MQIKHPLGGNGTKEIVKKVIDKDPMTPIETAYPPSMIKTATYLHDGCEVVSIRPRYQ